MILTSCVNLKNNVNNDITFDISLIQVNKDLFDSPKKPNWIKLKPDDNHLSYFDINVDAVVNSGNYTFLATATIGGLDDIKYTKIFEFNITSCDIADCEM